MKTIYTEGQRHFIFPAKKFFQLSLQKCFFLLLCCISFTGSYGQSPEGEEYLIARTVERGFRGYYLIYIDYSNATGKKNWAPNEPLYDSTGKTIRFETESAALNQLGKQGWVLVSVAPINNSQNTYGETKYIFRRKIVSGAQPIKLTAE